MRKKILTLNFKIIQQHFLDFYLYIRVALAGAGAGGGAGVPKGGRLCDPGRKQSKTERFPEISS